METTVLNITLKKYGAPRAPAPHLPPLVEPVLLFRGESGNPFLAPRGVCLAGNRLIVSDTGQNRIFIWNRIPEQEYQRPDLVLGQIAVENTGRNAGVEVGAGSLQYPSGIWSDGEKLIVADAWNHRVLIWHAMPVRNGQPADVVLGQPDFGSNLPNVAGIGHAPDRRSLNWPYGVCSDGLRLFIADTGNRRVLVYEEIPTQSYAAADAVIGKENFDERDYDHRDAIWPYSVKLSPSGALAITDTQYYRVLIWHRWQDALTQQAAVIIGQPDLESNGQNQFGLFPKDHTLSWCYDSCFYQNGLFVADTGNSRVLWFDKIPHQHNACANNLIGKADFNTGSENMDTVYGTEKTLYWPFSLSIDPAVAKIAIADTGNHRVFIHKIINSTSE